MEEDFKIEVFPLKCNDEECDGFHWVILRWQPPVNGRNGFWHNVGSGIEISPEIAFKVAMEKFKILQKEF